MKKDTIPKVQYLSRSINKHFDGYNMRLFHQRYKVFKADVKEDMQEDMQEDKMGDAKGDRMAM